MKDRKEPGYNPPQTNQDIQAQNTRNWYDRPHEELVADTRGAVAKARAEAEEKGQPFDATRWVGMELTRSIGRATSEEARRNRSDASFVWDAISHPFIQDKEYKRAVEDVLINGTALRQSNLVILNPKAVKLIDAMADAVGVPHARGQRTFDLLTDQQKIRFRQIHTTIARRSRI